MTHQYSGEPLPTLELPTRFILTKPIIQLLELITPKVLR